MDVEAVLQAAASLDVAVELNAHPSRLDLHDRHLRRAKELGVKVAVSTDAHSVQDLDLMSYGVDQAGRGLAWRRGRLEHHVPGGVSRLGGRKQTRGKRDEESSDAPDESSSSSSGSLPFTSGRTGWSVGLPGSRGAWA